MKPHLLLNNPRGEQRHFDASRGFETNMASEPPLPSAYRPQKTRLNASLIRFNRQRSERLKQRTLNVPTHFEYIRVDFFVVFNNNPEFRTKTRFRNEFGLAPVAYINFNKTVYFAIVDETRFRSFTALLEQFINSRDSVQPGGTPYAIMTLIYDLAFLTTEQILLGQPEGDVILSLVKKEELPLGTFQTILNHLREYVATLPEEANEIEFVTDESSTIEIKNISHAQVRTIAQNYDIIYRIQSLRTPTIRPNEFNVPELTWGIRLRPPVNEVYIGVLDNGVRSIAPLADILVNHHLDITNKLRPNPLSATHPHGTVVASLAALGVSFFDSTRTDFTSDAYIVPIKILDFDRGHFNIYDIEAAIKTAVRAGVRVFNLSVSGYGKMYNETITEYAYLLDRLAYENDILIFIAAGNLEDDSIEAMQEELAAGNHHDFHMYPFHFYNPGKASDSHVCEATNLCMPGESFNNITVGAIADNYLPNPPSGLTPLKELPAYYTRKHHIDYNRKINGTDFTRSLMNGNINKPDIVMPGGDRIGEAPGMQVLGFGDNGNDFYNKDSGTSLATPLAANLAARILSLYPSLNMQSVKALIINSAEKLVDPGFLDNLVANLRQDLSQEKYNTNYDHLTDKQKKYINEKINSDDLYHRLVGYGVPDIAKALYSDAKAVTMVIQDSISVDAYKVVNLNFPRYLRGYSKKASIITLKATLCFKFPPVWNNHLGYNPLHISFNFIKSVAKNDPVKTAEIIADRDHRYFSRYIQGLNDPKEIARAKSEALGIKKKLGSWSEDFFPPSTKPFSNTQQLKINISIEELEKIGSQLAIVVRCTHKRELERSVLQSLESGQHPFSIALHISERPNTELADFDLHDELIACNQLDVLARLDLEAEDLEAEAE
jgi:subtilisin family serine protease